MNDILVTIKNLRKFRIKFQKKAPLSIFTKKRKNAKGYWYDLS
jgi:hypothetical protein